MATTRLLSIALEGNCQGPRGRPFHRASGPGIRIGESRVCLATDCRCVGSVQPMLDGKYLPPRTGVSFLEASIAGGQSVSNVLGDFSSGSLRI